MTKPLRLHASRSGGELAAGPGAARRTTLADLALYSYTAVAAEGDVLLEPWPQVRAWLSRVESLPRFVPMHRSRSSA
jgi:glutathione S-transferase